MSAPASLPRFGHARLARPARGDRGCVCWEVEEGWLGGTVLGRDLGWRAAGAVACGSARGAWAAAIRGVSGRWGGHGEQRLSYPVELREVSGMTAGLSGWVLPAGRELSRRPAVLLWDLPRWGAGAGRARLGWKGFATARRFEENSFCVCGYGLAGWRIGLRRGVPCWRIGCDRGRGEERDLVVAVQPGKAKNVAGSLSDEVIVTVRCGRALVLGGGSSADLLFDGIPVGAG